MRDTKNILILSRCRRVKKWRLLIRALKDQRLIHPRGGRTTSGHCSPDAKDNTHHSHKVRHTSDPNRHIDGGSIRHDQPNRRPRHHEPPDRAHTKSTVEVQRFRDIRADSPAAPRTTELGRGQVIAVM